VTTIFLTALTLVSSVLVIICLAVIIGKGGFLASDTDRDLMWIMINVLFPCLIFDRIIHTDAFSDLQNIWLPPLLGFLLTVIGIGVGFFVAFAFNVSATGLSSFRSKRTFAASVGILNYGFIPVPLVAVLFPNDDRTMGVLFLQYTGSELSIWTLVIFCLRGQFSREALGKILSMPIGAILIAAPLNIIWHSSILPENLRTFIHLADFLFDGQCGTIHLLGMAAVPMSLFMIGLTMSKLLTLDDIKLRWHKTWRIAIWSILIRLIIMPFLILMLAIWLPCTIEIKRILIIYGAMNSAVLTIALAKHNNGCEKTAIDTIISNTLFSIITLPIWIALGFYIIQ
jgi:predicted permease